MIDLATVGLPFRGNQCQRVHIIPAALYQDTVMVIEENRNMHRRASSKCHPCMKTYCTSHQTIRHKSKAQPQETKKK
jgi:hypothetical protein